MIRAGYAAPERKYVPGRKRKQFTMLPFRTEILGQSFRRTSGGRKLPASRESLLCYRDTAGPRIAGVFRFCLKERKFGRFPRTCG